MDSEPKSLAEPSAAPPPEAGPRAGREDNQAAPQEAAHTEGRSTDRPTHTPRGARNGDHQSRPGALPPAPGRPLRVFRRFVASPALPALLVVVLVAVSWQVAVDGPLLGLDRWARHAVRESRHELHSTLLNHLGKALSDLGGSVPAIPVLLAGGALAGWRTHRTGAPRRWLPPLVAVSTTGSIPLLVVPAKAWFGRPGPFGVPLAPDQWGWYPSGHTTTATFSYGVAALLVARTVGAAGRRRLCGAAALLSVGVGLGLVWSDYHWLLDVVAGWCLAGPALWALARWLPAGPPPPAAAPDSSTHRPSTR
ncbi:phosphatase PAP2 family protein [Kitasatospora hibisci]|uniref:phosphatase PAP2 family protein n=1 Tax=Kitasatospora hibisci TaxID=3369522 RepID=UPI003754F1F2